MSDSNSSTPTRSLSKEIEVNAPVEAVWKALTDAEELTRWFPLDAKVTPGVDGTVWLSWRNEYEFTSAIEVWEPNRRLRLGTPAGEEDKSSALGATEQGEGRTLPTKVAIDYHLQRDGNRTILRLVHSGFSSDAEWDAWFDGTSRGWDYQLWGLKHYLENHPSKERDCVYVRKLIDSYSRDEAWQKLWGSAAFSAVLPLQPQADYAISTPNGLSLRGKVRVYQPPVDFIGTVENLNHATVRLQLEDLFGKRDVTITISTYGLRAAEATALRTKCADLLDELFPERDSPAQ